MQRGREGEQKKASHDLVDKYGVGAAAKATSTDIRCGACH